MAKKKVAIEWDNILVGEGSTQIKENGVFFLVGFASSKI